MTERRRRFAKLSSVVGALPMILVGFGLYVVGILYSVTLSFTNSKLMPQFTTFVGFDNYVQLWSEPRWLVSVENFLIFGVLSILLNMGIGFLLACCLDQRVRQEDTFRTILLYPYAMSLVVTGLVWQWMLDPGLGIQETVRQLGWSSFGFAPLTHPETAIYGILIAGVWQASGVTMAIMLAGLRGIDADIWKASRVDGIPTWKTYLFIALPMMKGAVTTAFVLQCVSVVRVYDLIVAQTDGGPGIATEMPAKFVIDLITKRQNVGLGMAAATLMLLPILLLIGLRGYFDWRRKRMQQRAA